MRLPCTSERLNCDHEDHPILPGALDGVTIMRYADVTRGRVSGGVEQYLRHLDHGLLQRHRLTMLQTYMTTSEANEPIEIENVGMGRILWVPVTIREMGRVLTDLPKRMGLLYLRMFHLWQQEGKGQYLAKLSAIWSVLRHAEDHLRYKTAVLGDHLSQLLITHNVDLLALHWLNHDTGTLISRAGRAGIPYVFINHFSNARFSMRRTRKWITDAAALGGVSDEGIPEFIRSQFINLSDAVDTDFFSPEKTLSVGRSTRPIVLLPARIEHGKGHHDLLEVARSLVEKKVDLLICFAGAVESEPLHQELRKSAAVMGLEGRVLFLGERSPAEIRDWYAKSSVVVLPTYSEGLGRVLLEAQAMKKPVVAYDSGGTSRALLSDETGFLVNTGDVNALAAKISFLLANDEESIRMGERGREFVSARFSLPALIQRHEAFYLTVLTCARARREPTVPRRRTPVE
jgi:glycosyltransferase involved in cell wall biosynthesis